MCSTIKDEIFFLITCWQCGKVQSETVYLVSAVLSLNVSTQALLTSYHLFSLSVYHKKKPNFTL